MRSVAPHRDIGQPSDPSKLTFFHLKMRTLVWKLTGWMFVKVREGAGAQQRCTRWSHLQGRSCLRVTSPGLVTMAAQGCAPFLSLIVPATSCLLSGTAVSLCPEVQTDPFLLEGSSSPGGPSFSAPTSTPGLCPVVTHRHPGLFFFF